jgi:predicted transposase YbfD/YdcC
MNQENKMLTFARTVPEHRINRKKLHLSEDIVFVTLAAVICGADTWEDIAGFGRSKKEFLQGILSLPGGIPCADTFNRFFAALDPKAFEALFMAWVKELCGEVSGVVAIDGKTVRGSRKKGNKSAIHMVSAFACSNNLVLGQIKTEQKSNEITAIPELLKLLDIEGCTVTIDAMGCQTKIAKAIVEKQADYMLSVKENQKELYANIVDTFRYVPKANPVSHTDIDAAHGRVETRTCTVTSDLSEITRIGDWENIQSVVKLESVRYTKSTKETTTETRYYITNKSPDPMQIEKIIRSHWGIENKLHWLLDVAFNEDKSRKRDQNAAENFSVILRMALNLVKDDKTTKRSVRGKRLKAGWDNEYLLTLMNF